MRINKARSKPTGVPGIVQDGPDRFIVRARWRDPRTGQRRKREAVATTLAEAVKLKEALVGEELPKEQPTRQRFADYAEQWIGVHGDLLAPSTRERYIGALAHATVALGKLEVHDIKPSDIRAWIHHSARKRSNATVNGWLRVLRRALDDLVEDGVLEVNPARSVRSLPEGRTKGRRGAALSVEEFRLFTATTARLAGNEISEDVARMILVVAWTGMRRGELLALRWSDNVDGELRIERSVWNRSEKATKTDDPRRVTIVTPLVAVLDEQRQWLLKTQHPGLSTGLMFPSSPLQARGGARRRGVDEISWYRTGSVLNAPLRKIEAEAGTPPISLHSLRRTFENLGRKAGVEDLVRRSWSGWRTEEAQAIYATVDRSERDAAADAVVRLVMGS